MNTSRIPLLITFVIFAFLPAKSQENPDTSYWSQAGKAALTFSQVGLSNWASGGEPSVSFNAIGNYSLKYEKSAHVWENVLNAGYGTQRPGNSDEVFRKTDDNLLFISRYGYKLSKKWYVSALGNLRTQFTNGYKYVNDTAVFVSGFMAPGYTNLGVGITYVHKFAKEQSFSFTFSPVNLKTTFVLDDDLSSRGMYGVERGNNVRFRGGINLLVGFKKELIRNITLGTNLITFTPYEDLAVIDVNWDLNLWFRINEFFSANISTQLIYDQDVAFTNDAGQEYFSAVQFKEVLGLGLAYSF